jgi:hypothetical protein
MSIRWQSLKIETRLDVLLSEEIWCRNWNIVLHWAAPGNAPRLIEALAQRGVLWDRNILPAWQQLLYIETAAKHIRNDWRNRSVKTHLMQVLYTS